MNTMRGVSRQSFEGTRRQVESLLAGQDARAISRDLFAITHVLDGAAGLRRALTDPSRDEASKTALATSLFASKVNAGALAIVSALAGKRWSSPSELSDAIELIAVEVEAAAAEQDGTLDAVESELFRFARVVASESGLRQALTDRSLPVAQKQGLIEALLADKASTSTRTLVSALVSSPRGRSIERGLEAFAQVAADRRGRSIAHVTSAVALTEAQRERLASALAAQAGRPIQLNVEVDPSIVGGISVRLGDELFDGTIINRIADARRRLAG